MESTMKNHFLNLYSFALADRNFEERELLFLYEIAEKNNISREAVDEILLNPFTAPFTAPTEVKQKITYLYDFARMIWVDREISPHEEHLLKIFCNEFGFRNEHVDNITNFFLEKAQEEASLDEVLQIVEENM